MTWTMLFPRAKLLKFADDTKLYFSDDPSIVSIPVSPINDDLSRVVEGCFKWKLRLNIKKMSLSLFGTN